MLDWQTIPEVKYRVSFQAQGGSDADALPAELAGRRRDSEWDVLICQLITQCGMVGTVHQKKKGFLIVGKSLSAINANPR